MKFYLVSALDSSIKREVDIPDEIVVKKKRKQHTKNKSVRKQHKKKKTLQTSKPTIIRYGATHHSNKRTTKSK